MLTSSCWTRSILLLLANPFLTALAAPTTEPFLRSGLSLDPKNFHSTIQSSQWLIEFYSPKCQHCRQFAPTWKELGEKRSNEGGGMSFAQVDCVAHSEFCATLSIAAIPTLLLFNEGTRVKEYNKATRDIADLLDFVDEENAVAQQRSRDSATPIAFDLKPPGFELAATRTSSPTMGDLQAVDDLASTNIPLAIGNGISVALEGESELQSAIEAASLADQPIMIKLYAPYCSHCKAFAPKWKLLAIALQKSQSPVQLFEVDCTSKENSGVCSKAGVQRYPTVFWYYRRTKLEYMQAREVLPLQSWIKKVLIASVSESISPATSADIDSILIKSSVVCLMLHPQAITSLQDSTIISATSPLLISHASFHTSSSPTLFAHYNLSTASSHILFFKSIPGTAMEVHNRNSALMTQPFSILSNLTSASVVSKFVNRNKWPLVVELDSDTFSSVMKSMDLPSAPGSTAPDENELVILHILSIKDWGGDGGMKTIEGRIRESAEGWKYRRDANLDFPRRNAVIHAYIDGDKWERFLSATYGKPIGVVDGNGVRLLVVDNKARLHYDTTLAGSMSLTEASQDDLFELIEEGIWKGVVQGVRTESISVAFELWSNFVQTAKVATSHPFLTLLAIIFLTSIFYRILQHTGLFVDTSSMLVGVRLSGDRERAPKLE